MLCCNVISWGVRGRGRGRKVVGKKVKSWKDASGSPVLINCRFYWTLDIQVLWRKKKTRRANLRAGTNQTHKTWWVSQCWLLKAAIMHIFTWKFYYLIIIIIIMQRIYIAAISQSCCNWISCLIRNNPKELPFSLSSILRCPSTLL